MTHTEIDVRIVTDDLLRQARWNPSDKTQVLTEGTIPGGRRADSVLLSRNGRPLGIIEAKRSAIHPYAAKQQSLPYAKRIGAPFIFLTNTGKTDLVCHYLKTVHPGPAGRTNLVSGRPGATCQDCFEFLDTCRGKEVLDDIKKTHERRHFRKSAELFSHSKQRHSRDSFVTVLETNTVIDSCSAFAHCLRISKPEAFESYSAMPVTTITTSLALPTQVQALLFTRFRSLVWTN